MGVLRRCALTAVVLAFACGPQSAPPPSVTPPTREGRARVVERDGRAVLGNGQVEVEVDPRTGAVDFTLRGRRWLTGAASTASLSGLQELSSLTLPRHQLAAPREVHDEHGTGLELTVLHSGDGEVQLEQRFTAYDGHPWVFVQTRLRSTAPVRSNHLGVLVVEGAGEARLPPGPEPRLLDVPFDNDEWVRFDARALDEGPVSGTSFELAALYEASSGEGLVLGSVTHDTWKTGLRYDATPGGPVHLELYGGAAVPDVPGLLGPTRGKDGTHDLEPHGALEGTEVDSPRVVLVAAADVRDALVAFGEANARVAPRRQWTGPVPFGWMSWGAFGLQVTEAKVNAVADALVSTLVPEGFADHGVATVNIDAGLTGDPRALVAALHARGLRAGTYRAPFTLFLDGSDPHALDAQAGHTGYTYAQLVLRDARGTPLRRHGAFVLDSTHPGGRALIDAQVDEVNALGHDFLKLDFVSDGALEGAHFDPQVRTGLQAYQAAMRRISERLRPDIFVSLSIAPLFPHQFAHARRLSCDVIGQLNDELAPAAPHYGSTEYALNALTFGHWMHGTLYDFTDADAVALTRFAPSGTELPEEWARTRVLAAAISGSMLLDSTDLSSSEGLARARRLLTPPEVTALVRRRVVFRPLELAPRLVQARVPGYDEVQTGSGASRLFMLDEGDAVVLAAFNLDAAQPWSSSVPLSRLGLDDGRSHAVTDLWTRRALAPVTGQLDFPLAPGRAELWRLAR
ncbi:MAG: hypothetical protein K1X89_15400 [Myxococcaceae bacterium]|nr:hypothetical protein [Myxococcaceae bacterium]